MTNDQKNNEDLLKEVEELRRRVAELEALEDRRKAGGDFIERIRRKGPGHPGEYRGRLL